MEGDVDLMDAISQRRSIREYTMEAVDEGTLRRLIAAAIEAPSAVNEQPWSFSVVTDQALLARISREAKTYMLAAMPAHGPSEHLTQRLSDPEFHIFYHAPALILISARSVGPWAVEDCALAAQNLMLAARASGLGTCWIGFAQGWLGTPAGKQALDLPVEFLPVAPIIVGHPTHWPPPVPRKEAQVRWIG